jgi:predicted amidohydrolase YtcJ
MKRKIVLSLGILGLFAATPPQALAQEVSPLVLHYADTVFYNGPVLTMDKDTVDFSVARGVAVRDGKILAVGSAEDILKLAGPNTKKIDLEGKAVMPGVIDTHSHPNRYALAHYAQDYMAGYLKFLEDNKIKTGRVRWEKGKDAALADLKPVIARAGPDDLIYATSRGNPVVMTEVRIADLDAIAPNNRLYIAIGNEMWGLVNTPMLKSLTDAYGPNIPGILKDKDGKPTGLLFGTAGTVIGAEMLPQTPPELLAPIFGKELEEWAAIGVTTLSSRFRGTEISAYAMLDREGKLPIRIAYTSELARWNPNFERYMKRIGNTMGHGTDRMWLIGLSVGIPDGSPPGGGGAAGGDVCASPEKRERFPDDSFYEEGGFCYWEQPGDPTKETVMTAYRYGYRIAGVHTFGDKGNLIALDTYKKAEAQKGASGLPEMRPSLDHGMMISPDVIKETVAEDAWWSLQVPMFFGPRTSIVSRVFGEAIAHQWSMPIKSLIDSGAKVTYGADAHEDPNRQPMHSLQVMLTRETNDGRVWGAKEAISRRQGLLMLTRWGAGYVMKEKELGSLEPGKLADLLVLDKDPLSDAVPDTEIKNIKVLQTYIGGDLAYDAATAKPFPPAPRQAPADGLD